MNDVLVIGCGPTGAVLSLLLAKCGLTVTVLEKDEEVFPVPRATHVDEETLRNFQATGLMAELAKHTEPFGFMEMVTASGKRLFEEEIIQPESEHGYTGSRFFDQPAFEKVLRKGLSTYPNVVLLTGAEVTRLTQNNNGVTATVLHNGEEKEYTAKYAVGCDGGRSITRQTLGIDMVALEPAREWIIVDSLLKNEADKSILPNRFQYIFNKEHLTIYAHGFGINRRWEFQLKKGEAQPSDEVVKEWVSNYISLDKIEITRIAKYAHNSLVAKQWQSRRVFLAGDAAHMMPPSAGQGLCSGVRDAINLAWKLNEVIKGDEAPALLETYEQERKTHLYDILKRTLFISGQLNAESTIGQAIRSMRIQAIQSITPLKNYLRKRYNVPPALQLKNTTSPLAGQFIPQLDNSDDTIGYNYIIVLHTSRIEMQDFPKYKDAKYISSTKFDQWLRKHGVDYVIARPDKVII